MKIMTKPVLVMAAIIEKDGSFLITQRPDDGRHIGGKWEFPGGKVEFGEDPRKALEREIEEELGIKVKAEEIFEMSSHVYDDSKHIILLACHCTFQSGTIQYHDISDHTWVPPEKMMTFDMAKADLPFVKKLQET